MYNLENKPQWSAASVSSVWTVLTTGRLNRDSLCLGSISVTVFVHSSGLSSTKFNFLYSSSSKWFCHFITCLISRNIGRHNLQCLIWVLTACHRKHTFTLVLTTPWILILMTLSLRVCQCWTSANREIVRAALKVVVVSLDQFSFVLDVRSTQYHFDRRQERSWSHNILPEVCWKDPSNEKPVSNMRHQMHYITVLLRSLEGWSIALLKRRKSIPSLWIRPLIRYPILRSLFHSLVLWTRLSTVTPCCSSLTW